MPDNKSHIRIVQVIGGGMVRAGTETLFMEVLRQIDRERYRMDFLVHTQEPCAYDEEIKALGSRIIIGAQAQGAEYRRPLSYHLRLQKLLRDNGPYDIMHCHTYLRCGHILRLARSCGIPSRITHIHPHVDKKRQTLFRAVYRNVMTRWITNHATCLITPSQSSMDAFKQICDCSRFPNKVLYNGIDLAEYQEVPDKRELRRKLALPPDQPLVSYVGRFDPHKNHQQVLRVADLARERGLAAHFAIAGAHGPCLDSLREASAKRSNVSLLVGIPRISELLFASDLFFFPSLNEGLGIVALEAAAAGLPIVATDLSTIREACYPLSHSFFFPPDDDEKAYASIAAILGDTQLRKEMSAAALPWARRFSIQEYVKKLCDIYETWAG
ncbi:glycosyltransferase family 4 protein [Candidatus Sumerlaeota bacterium]